MQRLAIFLLFSLTLSADAQQKIVWPEGKKAAIVLTYDDALLSQLNIAIPQLDSFKFKGTFFLDARMSETEMLRWRNVSRHNHELANHTLYHPCSSKSFPARDRYTSETYDAHAIIREIAVMNKLLFGIDGKAERTYAYPCAQTYVEGKDYVDTLRSTGLIKYARVGGGKNSIITDFQFLDPLKVPCWGVPDQPNKNELIDFAQATLERGGLGIYMFHGIGGDYIQVSADAHQTLVQFLAAHQHEIWVTTFMEMMDYVQKQK